jgi:HD-like signal output (HDOD) protein
MSLYMQIRNRTLNTGSGVVDIHTDDAGFVDGAAVVQQLKNLFASPGWSPPLPPAVAAEVMALSRSRDVDLTKMAALLEKDGLLAGATLRIAQSARYCGDRPVQTLREAVVRLGARGVHDVVLEAALSLRVFKTSNVGLQELMNRLRRHAVAVANAARVLCNYSALEGDHAFLCGLIHDIGLATALIAIGEAPKRFGSPSPEALASGLSSIHEEAGGVVARAWNLSPEVQWVVTHHHQLVTGGFAHPMVATLILAEHLADEHGCGVDAPGSVVAIEGHADVAVALKALSLQDRAWALAQKDVARVLDQL